MQDWNAVKKMYDKGGVQETDCKRTEDVEKYGEETFGFGQGTGL